MKFTCSRDDLVNNVSIVQRAVTTNSTVNILNGILIEASDDNKIKLTGYDLQTGIEADVEANVTEKGAVVTLAENVEGFCPSRQLTKEDGTTPKAGEKLSFKVIEFSKATKRITLSHVRTYEDAKRAEIAAEKAEKRAAADATKSTVKKINASVEKTTLGDIAGLAALKSAMEAEAKKGKKAAKDEE